MPAGQLGIVFALTSNAAGLSRGFRQANQEMSGFQAKARAFGKAAAIPLAAVGVAGARAAVQLVGEFDQAQKTIAQQTGATGAELQALTDDMRAAFGQVPQSMTEVAEALGTINTRFGSTGQTLQDQTRLFLDFSRVTGTQVSTAVSTLGRAAHELRRARLQPQRDAGRHGAHPAGDGAGRGGHGPPVQRVRPAVRQPEPHGGADGCRVRAARSVEHRRVAYRPWSQCLHPQHGCPRQGPADGPSERGGRDPRRRGVHRRPEHGDGGVRRGGRSADDDRDPGGELRPAGLQRAPRQGCGAGAGAGRGDADSGGAVHQGRQPDQVGCGPGTVVVC